MFFQQRGAPHDHLVVWLKSKDGQTPPQMWKAIDEIVNRKDHEKKIADFSNSLISSSIDEAICDKCEQNNDSEKSVECNSCKKVKETVLKFQTHCHKPSCMKKKKFLKIGSKEGHGKLDEALEDLELIVPVCRYNFPKNPCDETIYLQGFPSDHPKEDLKTAKEDYMKIRKYLLRLTNDNNFKDTEKWKTFVNMDFYQFLYEVGMFDEDSLPTDESKQQLAKSRYLTALRCEVKTSGLLLMKRSTKDVFINNYCNSLVPILNANHDIQYITCEHTVAQYISGYCTKNEGGITQLLKKINDEALATGEASKDSLRKLRQAMDKGREVSIQEGIYRTLSLKMTCFSSIVKFINTNHPDRREGLLKADLENLADGESIFHNSIHDYYQDRPFNGENEDDNEDWDFMSLAEFVSSYDILYKPEGRKNVIKLHNERGFIVKRGRQCVIR